MNHRGFPARLPVIRSCTDVRQEHPGRQVVGLGDAYGVGPLTRSPDGRFLVVAVHNTGSDVWDIATDQPLAIHPVASRAMSWSPNDLRGAATDAYSLWIHVWTVNE